MLAYRNGVYSQQVSQRVSILHSHLIYRLDNLSELLLLREAYYCVHLRINRILEDKRRKEVCQVLVLLIREAHLDVQDVEPDYCIVHQLHKRLNLFLHLLKKLLVLRGKCSAGLRILVEIEIVLNRLRLLLDVLFEDLSEVVLQADDRMIVHRHQVLPQCVYFNRVLRTA